MNFWHQICVQGPYLMRIDNLYLVRKMFKSPVRQDLSGQFGRPVLSGQETHAQSGRAVVFRQSFGIR